MRPVAELQQDVGREPPAQQGGQGDQGGQSGQGSGRRRRWALPWAVIALWVAVIALAMPLAGKLGDATRDQPVDYLPASADSTRVEQLVQKLPGGGTAD
ncbi:MAG: hypothetical protein ACRDOV_09180, partial [Streptomyces sp.]